MTKDRYASTTNFLAVAFGEGMTIAEELHRGDKVRHENRRAEKAKRLEGRLAPRWGR